jgi:hypothetical protein
VAKWTGKNEVIPGRCEASNPESPDFPNAQLRICDLALWTIPE